MVTPTHLSTRVDEALAAGATDVRFSQPLFHYVENFLNFPVGMVVPTGYYDRPKRPGSLRTTAV